jgi:hypothetical protein
MHEHSCRDKAKLLYMQSRKTINVSRCSPSAELIIHDRAREDSPESDTAIEIEMIPAAFSDQPLNKLALVYVEEMTLPLLKRIVIAFPNLEELTLVDESFLRQWSGNVVGHVSFFYNVCLSRSIGRLSPCPQSA